MALNQPSIQPSKLRSAPLPSRAIVRPQLLQRLQASAERGCLLTLIATPLGYGKSTLLAQYAASLGEPWAWYRCDASDNQPLSFLAHLSRLLRLPLPERSLSTHDEPSLWAAILTDLEQRHERFTLFFDDLHLLRAKGACRYLDELLRHAPPHLRLMAACEGTPALRLTHLRRDDRLQILDAQSLVLDSMEVRELATARGVALSSDSGYHLLAASEGWISGILFGLGNHDQHAHPITHESAETGVTALASVDYTARFLQEEVLRHLPNELLSFLERTSVVNTFDGELAVKLSGQSNAPRLIQQLQRQDVFIQQRCGERLPYSYHPMLRRTLYQRLRRRDQPQLLRLHRMAADWLQEQCCYAETVYQLGRAREFNRLLAVIEHHSFDLLREGRVKSIVDCLADVPGEIGIDHFTLAITEASTLIVTNDIGRASVCMAQLQRLLHRQVIPEKHPERVHQTLAFLRSRLAFLGGNFSHGLDIVDKALAQYPQTNAATAVLLFNRASGLFALGQLQAARQDAQRALTELQTLALSGYTNSVQMLLGQIELAQGTPELARKRFLALDQPLPANIPRSFYDLYRHLGLGLVLLQQNRLEQATQCLNQAEVIALHFPHSAGLPWVLHYQACTLAAQGNLPQARERWDEVRRLAREFKLYALYRQANACRARLAVREDDQAFIAQWLKDWHWCQRRYGHELQPEEWLAYAWVQRYLGQHQAAQSIVGNLQEQARAEDNQQLQVDLYLLQATLHEDHDERSATLAVLEQAMQLAARHGFGQLLQHEGRPFGELFKQLLNPATRRQLELQQPLPSREQLIFLPRPPSIPGAAETPGLLEPLTRREQDVLRRVARGQGNPQIAEGLYISLSTVKTHINNLFRKLDASDRDSALQAARTLKLID
ncbi:LuxR C-terminal-related transcriptional regulator [Pseudomonas sp. VI4.1]|uniref:LuxR C-terminal-related transcriptional regulator n=1 Tax=Pseudomonas sp. VI4.1 TaxID=1941346 RepID=UPI0015B49FE4|nr:LuxR C-terminal-related transcriptional regulator [Pseudomonas sp. VI4.1]